jgi:integrase/recombinase XerC
MALRVSLDVSTGTHQLVDDDRGPLDEANRFLRVLGIRGLSPNTIRAYAFDLLVLYRWFARTNKHLCELRQPDLLEFVAEQQRNGTSASSINRRLTTARQLYRFVADKELESAPGTSTPAPYYAGPGRDRYLGIHRRKKPHGLQLRVKTPRVLVEPLTTEQVRLFLRSLRRYRDLAIVYLMLLCGLRSKEIIAARLPDVSFEESHMRVRGKGNKERILPLPDLLTGTLADYIRLERPSDCHDPELFVVLQGKRRGNRMTPSGLRMLFRHRRHRKKLSNANAHRMRHTFGVDMARSGVRLPILQKMMGHANMATTLLYINLSLSDVTEEYRRAIQQIEKRYDTTGRG